ncbi:hypothetical protein GCM10007916_26240 [Psychromonas marina]|uniref:Alginate lyase 2 domain-containing protein n=1 Tax=Psychromonas marina TaxID=88364 RepID=A0ABQ6E2K8_9GAMM|nr:hypothetical protein GCM10007916_26240 [Psychromonas marina]
MFDGVPYDYAQYQDALDNANLQLTDLADCENNDVDQSCSKSDVVKAGGYQDYDNEHFYIDSTSGWLTFAMSGDSNRSELRFVENFKTNLSDTQYQLSAQVMPINPNESVQNSSDGEEITLLQVHNKGESGETDETVLSHPLLRVIWDGENRTDDNTNLSYNNAYWAVLKTNAFECSDTSKPAYSNNCGDSYDYLYLGDFNQNEQTSFDIIVGNERLIINVDNRQKVDVDISYWSHLYSYFKAGVYNQYENGNSIAQFKSITYSENPFDDESSTELPMNDLDPSLPPSANFDLSLWYISIPVDNGEGVATGIKEEELNDGYENTDYFYTAADGGMVFRVGKYGYKTSINTSYTRTEFREMLRDGEDIDTKGVNGNNWVFSSISVDEQAKAGAVDGILEATLAVNEVTTTGKSSEVGRVVIGQIHAPDDEPLRLYYRLLPGHSKGSVYFAHEANGDVVDSEIYIDLIGSKSSSSEPSDGIELDEKFFYRIEVEGDELTVTIKRDDKADIVESISMANSGYDVAGQYMYFKAGVYNQCKTDANGDEVDPEDFATTPNTEFAQATFYYLKNEH